MIRKILVANRGEIAVRVIRAARELGIRTVAVYSDADRESLPVKLADEAVCIGPPQSQSSYLNISNIISACEISNADAIHPGYGFLAENYRFAEACEDTGIVFIGPPAKVIRSMGDKTAAKAAMRAAGVPVTPGSEDVVASVEEALSSAREIGYPVLLKAREGGGGKGMRIVENPDGLPGAFQMAASEARAAFGNGELYLEKLIANPRHIEIQLAGDREGRVVHFWERDCSIQRRHQKLIEESPSPALDSTTREWLGATAVAGAAEIGYCSLGTMEFLLDSDGHAYFMEMNTRLQVEHGVTEEVTGVDLVRLQILLAQGERMPLRQEEIRLTRHALECRINAEDPLQGFRPSPGQVTFFYPPGGPGVRLDTHVYPGYVIPPYYDSLLGKVVTCDQTREATIERMKRSLDELVVEGVKTTAGFHRRMMDERAFLVGDYDTSLAELVVERMLAGEASELTVHAPEENRADDTEDQIS